MAGAMLEVGAATAAAAVVGNNTMNLLQTTYAQKQIKRQLDKLASQRTTFPVYLAPTYKRDAEGRVTDEVAYTTPQAIHTYAARVIPLEPATGSTSPLDLVEIEMSWNLSLEQQKELHEIALDCGADIKAIRLVNC